MDDVPRSGWRFPPQRREVLVDPDRGRRIPPERLVASAGIRQGETVLDVGAGNGFWTAVLSRLVGPYGKVVAIDVEPIMLEELRARARARGLTNVEVTVSEELSIPLPDAMADAALIAFVLHEPGDPDSFLREVHRLLRPHGRALVLDWHKGETDGGPPQEHRITLPEATEAMRQAGFQVRAVPQDNEDIYVLLGTVAAE